MTKEPNRILGINPSTRYLGLAVFHDAELLDWRVKTFTGKWTKEKAERILDTIREQVELYAINGMVIKKLHLSRSSKNLMFLVSKIKALAKRNELKIYQYSIKKVEDFFVEERKLNKRNLAEAVISQYPVLSYELNKEKSNKNSYYIRAIEATALAAMYLQKHERC